MAELETIIAQRLLRRANLACEIELQDLLAQVLKSAIEGSLNISQDLLSKIPSALWSDGSDGNKPFVIHEGKLYLQKNWEIERRTLKKIDELRSRAVPSVSVETVYQNSLHLFKNVLQPAQNQALQQLFYESFGILTGGPGTGKTYTASRLIYLLGSSSSKPFRVAIAAPTGKAAAHFESSLKSISDLPENLTLISTTLHRLLHLSPNVNRFTSTQTIDADLVIVDEASMLDLSLLLHLLLAIGPQTRLLLLGDPDQLPPVESASLFPRLAKLYGHKLERSMRMGDQDLVSLAQAINRSDRAWLLRWLAEHPINLDISVTGRDKLVAWLYQLLPNPLFEQYPDPVACLAVQKKIRVLGGLRQGPLGIDELNRLLLEQYLAAGREWMAIPILIAKNDQRQNLFNGTSGVLIRRKGHRFGKAYFEGREPISEMALPHFETAFCISVHKSQGSEFEEVIAFFQPGSERFGKEALYTAVTRAKQKASLVINEETLQNMFRSEGI